jgi:hypothetical protein
MANPNKRPLKPFRYNTRQRYQQFGNIRYAAANSFLSQQVSFEIPRVGFLAGILVNVGGGWVRDHAGGDTGTYSGRLFNFVKRLRVDLNLGAASIFDCSGYGTYLLNGTEKIAYQPDLGGTAPTIPLPNGSLFMDPHVFLSGDPTTDAGGLVLTYWIPIAANQGRNFTMGLINLQAPEVRATLSVQMINSLAELYTAGAVTTGTTFSNIDVTVDYLYYEVPNPDVVSFPPFIIHRCLEDRTPFANTGDVVYQIPRQGTLLRLIQNVITNNVNADDYRHLTVRINKTDDVYRMFITNNRFFARFSYGHSLPVGSVVWDFWNAEEVPASGDFRDAIDTEAISTLEFITEIASTATLGVGNNFVDSVREIVQILQV